MNQPTQPFPNPSDQRDRFVHAAELRLRQSMDGRVRGQFLAHAEHRDSLRKPRKAGTLLVAALATTPTQRIFG